MLKTFGKFFDVSARPLLVVAVATGAAVIYPPAYDQSTSSRNSKDGSRKNYPVRWFGDARKNAPCTHMGLWGGASEVLRTVKAHLAATQQQL